MIFSNSYSYTDERRALISPVCSAESLLRNTPPRYDDDACIDLFKSAFRQFVSGKSIVRSSCFTADEVLTILKIQTNSGRPPKDPAMFIHALDMLKREQRRHPKSWRSSNRCVLWLYQQLDVKDMLDYVLNL
jgi:hypothetical protein